MKRTCIKFLLPSLIFFQCAPSTQKESDKTEDSVAVVLTTPEVEPISTETTTEPDVAFDLDYFTKHPFANDYPYIKQLLREDSIDFTIVEQDTVDSESRTIVFDSARIQFLDSDPAYQDELGDLICSSDISSTKFRFNQGITIGMSLREFLSNANMEETSLMQDDATGYKYLQNEIEFDDDGHWKIIIWFKDGILIRIQSEISPCFYDYGD